MISYEYIYQLIFKEDWDTLLDVLYSSKKDISNDSMLAFAASTFESEFLKKVSNYPYNDKNVLSRLERLYQLDRANFYKLSGDNFEVLIDELVRRSVGNNKFGFANHFPNKYPEIIGSAHKGEKDKIRNESISPQMFLEVYNKMFEMINDKEDSATYYSGPRFIQTVKEFNQYFPDYNQYIALRNKEGKSTTRKIFYLDILFNLSTELRFNVIFRILDVLSSFKPKEVQELRKMLGLKTTSNNRQSNRKPKVFISYSWDDEEHKKWVSSFAQKLIENDIEIILDQFDLTPGKNLIHYVETAISKSDRIIVIFTPNYRLKADKRKGGVGYEYSIINQELYEAQTSQTKFIPVLRKGTSKKSIPTFMRQFIHVDFSKDEEFELKYQEILTELRTGLDVKG